MQKHDDLGWPTPERAQEVAYCSCGAAWFKLTAEDTPEGSTVGAVSLNGEGSVIAYSGVLRCLDCDTPWEPGGAVLRVVR